MDDIEVGVVLRDRRWGGHHTGTIVRTDTASVFVEVWPDAPPELAAWRAASPCSPRTKP